MTRKEAVYNLLKSRRWIRTDELRKAAGPEALRRVRELRAEGYEIKMRRATNDPYFYEYRMVTTKPVAA